MSEQQQQQQQKPYALQTNKHKTKHIEYKRKIDSQTTTTTTQKKRIVELTNYHYIFCNHERLWKQKMGKNR